MINNPLLEVWESKDNNSDHDLYTRKKDVYNDDLLQRGEILKNCQNFENTVSFHK